MYRPRDITDSIATLVIIIAITATVVYVLISMLGIQLSDIETAGEGVDTSKLRPLIQTPLGIDFDSMDSASKIIFGSVLVLMVFLVVTLGWTYWFKYRGKNK